MLNTTRLLRRMLAVRYSALMFCGPFHLAFFASVYHALKAFSASGCFSQNDFSVLTEITRMIQNTVFPNWEQARRVHGGLACPPLSFWRREMEMIGPEFSFDLLARALANRLHYLDPGAGHTRIRACSRPLSCSFSARWDEKMHREYFPWMIRLGTTSGERLRLCKAL